MSGCFFLKHGVVTYITSLLTFFIENRPTLYIVKQSWFRHRLKLLVCATKLAVLNTATLTCFLLQWLVIYFMMMMMMRRFVKRVLNSPQRRCQSNRCLLANRRSCNLVSKDKFPKRDCKCELVGFRCLEKLGSKIHFCFENQSAILFQSLWFHARKLDYWLSFLVIGSTSTG